MTKEALLKLIAASLSAMLLCLQVNIAVAQPEVGLIAGEQELPVPDLQSASNSAPAEIASATPNEAPVAHKPHVPQLTPESSEFAIPAALAGRVEFWKLIFTKYGRYQRVFHHREHPEIIYSVLDFERLSDQLGPGELSKTIAVEENREVERISDALGHLANGNKPRNEFEKRVERLFRKLPERGLSKYSYARDTKMIRSQSGIRERFREGIIRSGRYLYAMEEVMRLAALPSELARLPLIESSFDYTAYSSVGAAGIWQFMRSTGSRYLRISAGLDERRDPIIATRAAAQYLQNAYDNLGEWSLAITSYNHGVGGISRAVRETGSKDIAVIIRDYKGSSFGFASSNFFPEFLAALYIERNAERYFPGIKREDPWYFDEVKLERSTNYRDIIRLGKISEEDFLRLNPALLQPTLKGGASLPSGYMVKVPEGRGKGLIAGLGHGEFHSLHSSYETYLSQLRSKSFKPQSDKKRKVAVVKKSKGKAAKKSRVKAPTKSVKKAPAKASTKKAPAKKSKKKSS